jgi:hypothetical protein
MGVRFFVYHWPYWLSRKKSQKKQKKLLLKVISPHASEFPEAYGARDSGRPQVDQKGSRPRKAVSNWRQSTFNFWWKRPVCARFSGESAEVQFFHKWVAACIPKR